MALSRLPCLVAIALSATAVLVRARPDVAKAWKPGGKLVDHLCYLEMKLTPPSQASLLCSNYRLDGTLPESISDHRLMKHISLGGNKLRGTIPYVLGRLSELSELWLMDNRLTGTIPPELGKLTKLQQLMLQGNRLEGTVPPELGKLTKLRWLTLGGNHLTGPMPPAVDALPLWVPHGYKPTKS